MSRTDAFRKLDLRPAFRSAAKPAFIDERPVNGWDTETANGAPFVLSWCFEGREPDAINALGDTLDLDVIIAILTHREARGAVNVWYNLDFDANVILSALPKDNLYELVVFNNTTYKGYEIAYIPAKLLSIKHAKHRYDHYDASQFFFGSLDAAGREWLGAGKETQGVDVKKFGNKRYRVRNLSKIMHYARIDAKRVRDLFKAFAETAEPLGIPCGRPYSTGYLGEQTMNVIFRSPGESKPGFSFSQMQAMAWESYRGGRFEVIERGALGEAVTVDINSAYPNVLRTLPDPASLRWLRVRRPSLQRIREADYGFVEAIVTTDASRPLQPFPIKADGKLQFPALSGVRIVCLKQDLEFGLRSGLIRDADFVSAWLAYKAPTTVYPFRFLEELYARRQQYKAEGKDKAQQVLKIIINSIYGKLCQLTESTMPCPDGEDPDFLPVDALPYALREWARNGVIEIKRRTRCGSYFNPFLASHITGLTRLNLLQTSIDAGFEADVLMLATDSIMVRGAAFDASSFHTSNDLGGWELETRGDAFVVGSGIYEIALSNGKVKARTRGFERGFGVFMLDLAKEGGLRAVAASRLKDPRIIPITSHRPLKIPQAIYQSFDVSDVGKFFEFPRGISAGMDSKRRWPRGTSVTWPELLKSRERSTPKSFDSGGVLA